MPNRDRLAEGRIIPTQVRQAQGSVFASIFQVLDLWNLSRGCNSRVLRNQENRSL